MKNSIASACVLFSSLSASVAATIPYQDNFQETTVGQDPAGWAEGGAGAWTIASGGSGNIYQSTISGTTGASTTAVQLTNLVGSDFEISSSFQVSDISSVLNIGFASFGAVSSFGNGLYLADINRGGDMRIVSIFGGTTTGFTGDTGTLGTVLNTTDTYELTLTGSYSGATLTLDFTVFDGTNSTTITATDTTPRTGEYFGLRVNNAATSDALVVGFNDYAVAVPEPGFAGLMIGFLTAGFLLIRRRR
ncbi:hypothetical protein [Puniceicoccus vermicola]|uniref:PEP-CTERM sorting domain-containing protein n=1 Tax=Puniceicoccus vermicola TaxID=388746 RepID=A0A7X1AZL8_9BACT|nr:hypothetical protein [Puniceicoccus vermicola]MBC2602906.1 hypothetical protein [Puniceicoccus vermicola]